MALPGPDRTRKPQCSRHLPRGSQMGPMCTPQHGLFTHMRTHTATQLLTPAHWPARRRQPAHEADDAEVLSLRTLHCHGLRTVSAEARATHGDRGPWWLWSCAARNPDRRTWRPESHTHVPSGFTLRHVPLQGAPVSSDTAGVVGEHTLLNHAHPGGSGLRPAPARGSPVSALPPHLGWRWPVNPELGD